MRGLPFCQAFGNRYSPARQRFYLFGCRKPRSPISESFNKFDGIRALNAHESIGNRRCAGQTVGLRKDSGTPSIGQADIPGVQQVRFNRQRLTLRQIQAIAACRAVPGVRRVSGQFRRRIKVKKFDAPCGKLNIFNFAQARGIDPRRYPVHALNFPLIADSDRKVARLYGMIHPQHDELYTVRTVFVIDPKQKIRLTITYPQTAGRNFDEILRVIDSLQLTDSYSVSTPVNWEAGQDVIIVPAVSNSDAERRFPLGWRAAKPYLRLTPDPRSGGREFDFDATG